MLLDYYLFLHLYREKVADFLGVNNQYNND
jgi:hypothetical protein